MRQRAWTNEELAAAVQASRNWADVNRALGLSVDGGGSYAVVRRVAAELGLDSSHFRRTAWNKGQGSGRDQEKQRVAKRRWYGQHKDVYLARNQKRYASTLAKMRELKDRPCVDCGNRYPVCCMDFDHLDASSKVDNVTAMVRDGKPWAQIQAEIDKCDVVCANCHRIRTATRAGWTVNGI